MERHYLLERPAPGERPGNRISFHRVIPKAEERAAWDTAVPSWVVTTVNTVRDRIT
jgi:hypothetical protein